MYIYVSWYTALSRWRFVINISPHKAPYSTANATDCTLFSLTGSPGRTQFRITPSLLSVGWGKVPVACTIPGPQRAHFGNPGIGLSGWSGSDVHARQKLLYNLVLSKKEHYAREKNLQNSGPAAAPGFSTGTWRGPGQDTPVFAQRGSMAPVGTKSSSVAYARPPRPRIRNEHVSSQ